MKLTADIGQIRPTSSPATFSNVQFSSGPRSIGLCDNFISEHCQLTQSFFGTRPRSNTTQTIFSAKWTSKGNLGKQLTESAIWYHTHISESVLQGNIVHCVPFLKFHPNYEIPKVCQYCGKVPISFHNLSSQTHIAIKHTWHLSPFVQPGVKKLRISMFFVVCFLSKKPWFGVFLVNKMTNITYAIMFDKQWKCFKS